MKNFDRTSSELSELLAQWTACATAILNETPSLVLNARQRVALALLQLSREHAMSISILLLTGDRHVTGSCLALLRPMFDALLRGWWCGTCLSDQEFSRKWDGEKLFEKKDRMLNEVMAIAHPDLAKAFRNYAESVQTKYHDFTHGGTVQVLRRFGADGHIGVQGSEQELAFVAAIALAMDIQAAELMVQVMGCVDYVRALRGLQEKLGMPA